MLNSLQSLIEKAYTRFVVGDNLPDFMLDKISPEPMSGCWLWTGPISKAGYGTCGKHGKQYAHRIAYETLIGKIPNGLCIDHLCRVRSCVNPAHMEPVTRGENVRRGLTGQLSKARAAAQTHCKHGHPRTPENTRISRGRGTIIQRSCKICGREGLRRRRAVRRVSS